MVKIKVYNGTPGAIISEPIKFYLIDIKRKSIVDSVIGLHETVYPDSEGFYFIKAVYKGIEYFSRTFHWNKGEIKEIRIIVFEPASENKVFYKILNYNIVIEKLKDKNFEIREVLEFYNKLPKSIFVKLKLKLPRGFENFKLKYGLDENNWEIIKDTLNLNFTMYPGSVIIEYEYKVKKTSKIKRIFPIKICKINIYANKKFKTNIKFLGKEKFKDKKYFHWQGKDKKVLLIQLK